MQIGTVTFPSSAYRKSYKAKVTSRLKTWKAKDGITYIVDRPNECIISIVIHVSTQGTTYTDLLAYYNANQGTLFSFTDPFDTVLTNCRFRKGKSLKCKPIPGVADLWEFNISFEWTDFTEDDTVTITDIVDATDWSGGAETNSLEMADGFMSDGSYKQWLFSDPIQRRSFSFTIEPDRATLAYDALKYYASKFYESITISTGFTSDYTGIYEGNSIGISLNTNESFKSDSMTVREST